MHYGFHIVDIPLHTINSSSVTSSSSTPNTSDTSSTTPSILASYFSHTSLAYGGDWNYNTSTNPSKHTSTHYISTCSFYDKQVHTWKYESNTVPTDTTTTTS